MMIDLYNLNKIIIIIVIVVMIVIYLFTMVIFQSSSIYLLPMSILLILNFLHLTVKYQPTC